MGRAGHGGSQESGLQPQVRRPGVLAPAVLALGAVVALTVLGSPAGALEPVPSSPPVTQEQASAAELQAKADAQAGALAAGQVQRDAAMAKAAAALEIYQVALRRSQAAEREAKLQRDRLAAAERATAQATATLSRYLGSMYRNGVGDTRLTTLTSLVDSPSPQRLFGGLGLATRVGESQDDAVAGLARAQADQADASAASVVKNAAAAAASVQADEARKAADATVAAAVARVEQASVALSLTTRDMAVARARESRLAAAELIARQRSGVPAAAVEGAFANRTGTCAGASTAGYPNGRIPLTALCPLWGTSGQVLRADAAAAFDAMSRAYAEVFSSPLCVTDSYRDYAGQVAVRAAKPTLAAVPGTSNHGWGVALDLCDGIQTFGSPQHRWMQDNSMAFGFFHPAWAQAGGSKPEAWHWEYAG